MAAEFILRSKYEPAKGKLVPMLDAFRAILQELESEVEWKRPPDPETPDRIEAVKRSIQLVKNTLFSVQCGYFSDPYNKFNLLSFCDLGEMRIFGVIGAPREDDDIFDVMRHVARRLQQREGWELLDALVQHGELTPRRSQLLLDKLTEAKPLMERRLISISDYWFDITGQPLRIGEWDDYISHFKSAYRDLRGLLEQAVNEDEALLVSY